MENYPIFVLQNELETIKKRLDSDVIVDLRFKEEIDEDKDKVRQLKRSIEVLKACESVNIADLSIKAINRVEVINENVEIKPSCLGAVSFQLFQELYGSYVQMDDRFESVHIWSEELALRNKGRWTPILISKSKYEAEKLHS